MKNKSDKKGNKDEQKKKKDSSKPYRTGNDVSSEIKIANAGGHMEGGDNKQWHMDQGNFEDHEKESFENKPKDDRGEEE